MTEYTQYIVSHIRGQITGDYEKDMQYLYDCSEKYKEDEESADILREIASMMYEILPDDQKEQVGDRLKDLHDNFETTYQAVLDMIKCNDTAKARTMIEELIASVEGRYVNDDKNIYLSLNHIMELYEYSYYFKTDRNIKCTDVMYNEYYRTYAQLLCATGEYEKALDACNTAIEWNPVDLESHLQLAEVYILMGNHDEEYRQATENAYRYCCTRATMARYYRNMGRYYLDKYKPETARALYVYSNIYFSSEAADSALQFIESALNASVPKYEIKELQQILEENDVKLGPDADTIGIIYRVGNLMLESKDYDRARDCFAIVYDITQDEETGTILAQLMNSQADDIQ